MINMQPGRQWSQIYTRALFSVDPTAPQATQPVTRLRPVFTHTGPERKQPPPPPKAHFTMDHRSAVWSPSRTGGALQVPTEETDADRQEETGDSVDCRLQNFVQNSLNRRLRRLNSATSDFRARSCKIESKLERLTDENMNDEKRERRLWALRARVHADFADFFEACNECG